MKTFLGQEDYESVLANMRLADNSLMPIPVVLLFVFWGLLFY